MDKWESLVDRLIRESMERGEFDDLPGSGEPIDLAENPFEDPDLRTAHRLLRNAGFAPAWIEERKDIEATFRIALDVLTRARRLYSREGPQWIRAVEEFRHAMAELNHRIQLYNLKSPASLFHRKVIDIEQVIRDIESRQMSKGSE